MTAKQKQAPWRAKDLSFAPLGLDRESCHAIFRSHDVRFDGRVFVGVKTTGIYCRPVCRARTPRSENCVFFPSAAAAEAMGFRPCLKCRPELAPGEAPVDASARIVQRAVRAIEEDECAASNVARLAQILNISERQLRRVFQREYGVSPARYLQTQKLLLAKSLLTDTVLSVTDVAFTAGFKSIRRFNELFKKHYRLAPRDFRRNGGAAQGADAHVTVLLGYRPPYRWQALLDFLAGRVISGVESVQDDCYRRTVRLSGENNVIRTGWLQVSRLPHQNALAVTVSSSLLDVLAKALARIRRLFDLNANPAVIDRSLEVMNRHKPGCYVSGTRVPGCFDPFEMTVRAILGQQVSVKAAQTLSRRVAQTFGDPIDTPFGELCRLFPSAQTLAGPVEDQLGALGVTGARARCIRGLAQRLQDGVLRLDLAADPLLQMERLLALPGFGPWTANYVALRALGWPDVFLHTDYGIQKALAPLDAKQILKLSEAWKPWRSYATLNLWNSLDHTNHQEES